MRCEEHHDHTGIIQLHTPLREDHPLTSYVKEALGEFHDTYDLQTPHLDLYLECKYGGQRVVGADKYNSSNKLTLKRDCYIGLKDFTTFGEVVCFAESDQCEDQLVVFQPFHKETSELDNLVHILDMSPLPLMAAPVKHIHSRIATVQEADHANKMRAVFVPKFVSNDLSMSDLSIKL